MYKVFSSILFFIIFLGNTYAGPDSLNVSGCISGIQKLGYTKAQLTLRTYSGQNLYYSSVINKDCFSIRIPLLHRPTVVNMMLLKNSTELSMDLTGRFDFYMLDGNIRIKGNSENLENTQFLGGIENELMNDLRKKTAPFIKEINSIRERVISGSLDGKSEEVKELISRSLFLTSQKVDLEKGFIDRHSDRYISLYLLSLLKLYYTADDYASTFTKLSTEYNESKFAQNIRTIIKNEEVTKAGTVAADFVRTSVDGQQVKLSDFRDKYVLLDFWGSWCGPCKASMPHLLDLYNKYKNCGFVILGVAQEKSKTVEDAQKSWTKAIDELGIHWVNVLNNECPKQDIVSMYNVKTFPTKILIDNKGRVILRISGSATNDIDVKLKEIYKF